LIRVSESFGQKERGGESKKKESGHSSEFFFRLQESFCAIRHYSEKKLASARFPEQFSEILKQFLEPIQIFHLADCFETLSILVIFASFVRCSEHCCLLLFGVAA
jgi:hypothetical protein